MKKYFLTGLLLALMALKVNGQITLIDKNWQQNVGRSDEFTGYSGIFPKWTWYYVDFDYIPDPNGPTVITNRVDNLSIINNDIAVITIKNDNYTTQGGISKPYSGAEFKTNDIPNGPGYYLYGYFESKIKLPKGNGYHPAFWLWNGNDAQCWYNELDILEPYGQVMGACTTMGTNMHVINNYNSGNACPIGTTASDFALQSGFDVTNLSDMSLAYHIYGCEWLPDRIVWYFDNKIVREIRDPLLIPQHPMMVTFDDVMDYPISSAEFTASKSTMEIDYFRYYELKKNCTTVINQSSYDFTNSANFSIKKSYTIYTSSIPTGQNSTLRATDFVELKNDITIPSNTEFNIIITPCN